MAPPPSCAHRCPPGAQSHPVADGGSHDRPGPGSPFSPIQNNSDLAQGLLPIRPSKVRRDDIYLWRQEGYMAPKPKPVRSVFTIGMVLAMALTILAAMTWAVAEPGLSLIYRPDLPLLY